MGKVHYQVVMTYYKLMRKLRSVGVEPTPLQLRTAADGLGALSPMPMGTQLEMTDLGGRPCGMITYRKAKNDDIIFFVHGGGFAFGSVKTHRTAVAHLCKMAACVGFIPEYRLTPEFPYPAALDDCVDAYTELIVRHPNRRVFIFGDSAGGNLAVETILAIRKKSLPLPHRLVLMSPWLDLSPSSESVLKNRDEDSLFDKNDLIHYSSLYVGNLNPKDAALSPIDANLSEFPPTLIQVAENELLYFDSVRFAQNLRDFGVDVNLQVEDNLFHSWQLFPDLLPEAKRSLEEAARFITKE